MTTTRPWTAHYGDAPASLEYPADSLIEMLDASAHEHGDQVAIEFLGVKIRYQRLRREAHAVARGLVGIGVEHNDRIAALLPNTPHAVIALYAASAAGARICFIAPDMREEALETRLAQLDPKWLILPAGRVHELSRYRSTRAIEGIVTAALDDYASMNRLRHYRPLGERVRTRLGAYLRPAEPSGVGVLDSQELPPMFTWTTLRRLGDSTAREPDAESGESPEVLLFTRGATGAPKLVRLGSENLNALALQTQVQGPLLPGQTLLSVVPFSLGLGLAIGVHAVIASGATSVLVPELGDSSHSLAALIRRHRPEYIVTAPDRLISLEEERKLGRSRLSFLMGVFSGGAPLPSRRRERYEKLLRARGAPIHIREGYGLAETVSACTVAPDRGGPANSVGVPLPDTEIVVLPLGADPYGRDTAACEPGERGQLWISGPTVARGYAGDEGQAFGTDSAGVRWLCTGDYGYMDDQGFFFVLDRVDRISIEGDRLVSPGEIERLVEEQPGVAVSCVLAGPVPTALIVPERRDCELAELEFRISRALADSALTTYPASIEFVRSLPLLPLGAVDYRTAAELYRHGLLPQLAE